MLSTMASLVLGHAARMRAKAVCCAEREGSAGVSGGVRQGTEIVLVAHLSRFVEPQRRLISIVWLSRTGQEGAHTMVMIPYSWQGGQGPLKQ